MSTTLPLTPAQRATLTTMLDAVNQATSRANLYIAAIVEGAPQTDGKPLVGSARLTPAGLVIDELPPAAQLQRGQVPIPPKLAKRRA